MGFLSLINNFLNSSGYEIKKIPEIDPLRKSLSESYSLLLEQGFRPKTAIDVGVAEGTPEIYSAFPEAYYLLVEPLSEFEPHLKSILENLKGSYIIAAAGSKAQQIKFNVHHGHLQGSSMYKETMGSQADGEERLVEMVRLDEIIQKRKLQGPYFLKIDVQGAELDVLGGCGSILDSTEVIVLEVSMFQFMKDAPEFHDVVLYMKKIGYVAYDIILGWNRPLDNALGQVDIVFVQENGRLRKDHSYSTIEYLSEKLIK
ncbi:FkbM family methyltransferase [Thermodesulfobacteriota bacterium]